MTLKIGDTIFVFDINRRTYRRDSEGRSYGGPIWREHWRPTKIVDETSRSWVLEGGNKMPKKNPPEHRYCLSKEDLSERVWIHENVYQIADHIKNGGLSYETLQKVADISGYTDKKVDDELGLA